jgi:hypothetical protein
MYSASRSAVVTRGYGVDFQLSGLLRFCRTPGPAEGGQGSNIGRRHHWKRPRRSRICVRQWGGRCFCYPDLLIGPLNSGISTAAMVAS